MHINQVTCQNFKGFTGSRALGPLTVIVGDNFTGKTTIPDAIRLALTGYLPQIGKLPGATYGALAGNPDDAGTMGVSVRFDTGRESKLTFAKSKKGAVSVDGAVPMDLALNPMLVDVRTFFAMKGADRVAAIFQAAGDVKLDVEALELALGGIEASPAKVRDRVLRRLQADMVKAFAKSGTTAQQAVEGLLAGWTDEAKKAREQHKIAAGAFAGMKLPAEIPERPKNLAELRAVRDGLVEKRGELAGLLRAVANAGSESVRLTAAIEEATQAEAEWHRVPKLGPEPKRPALLDRFDADREQIEELENALSQQDRSIEEIELTISALEGVTVCPTCGSKADNSRIIASHKTRLGETKASMERLQAELETLAGPFADIQSVEAEYQVTLADWQEEKLACDKAQARWNAARQHLDDLRSRVSTDNTDRNARIEALKAEVEKLPEANLAVEQAEQREQAANEYERLLEARDIREREVLEKDCEATVLSEAVKAINREVKEASEDAFETVLALSDDFTRGLIRSPLEFRDGELGRMENGGWIPHTAFSGTEQLLAYAGFSVALARTAGFKLVVLDEMGRLSLSRRQDVAIRMEELIAAGKIDQAILIDATVPGTVRMLDGRDALDVYGEKCVRIVL